MLLSLKSGSSPLCRELREIQSVLQRPAQKIHVRRKRTAADQMENGQTEVGRVVEPDGLERPDERHTAALAAVPLSLLATFHPLVRGARWTAEHTG